MDGYRPRPLPPLPRDAHKGTAGRVLCVCGSAEMPGAAILVVRAAHRAGAGRVTLGCVDRELFTVVPPASPETVLLDLSRAADPGAALAPPPGEPAFHARALGPGLGATPRTRALVEAALASSTPLVIDADGLNVLGGEPEVLAVAAGPVVVTPHGGEAARLLGRAVPRDDEGRIAAARELARRARAVCVLKGPGSVVTDGERVHVNATGNPGMATAGAGDVLTGVLAAYLAGVHGDPGYGVFDAVAAGVHVHGAAGDLAAAEVGRRGLVASDLVTWLPRAQRDLEGGAGGG